MRAGGYTPLKLQGVFGALAGQIVVAGLGGVIYAFYLRWRDRRDQDRVTNRLIDRRGWPVVVPGVLAATLLFVVLLWPTLLTNYRGLPPATARFVTSLEMLISFSVCGVGIMFFYALLNRRQPRPIAGQSGSAAPLSAGRRCFLALGIGAALAVAFDGMLRRFFSIGTFGYDGRQYSGPKVAEDHSNPAG